MTDKTIEQEIQAKGLTAPRITPLDIEANIISEYYFTAKDAVSGYHTATSVLIEGLQKYAPSVLKVWDITRTKIDGSVPTNLGLLTFCVLVLRNGFTVTGESACASPENFNAEIGRKIARENAVNKIWPLMGYELRSKLSIQSS